MEDRESHCRPQRSLDVECERCRIEPWWCSCILMDCSRAWMRWRASQREDAVGDDSRLGWKACAATFCFKARIRVGDR
jgi:hypothetical protein